MLTERRASILGFIVGEYVESAVPVGSEAIVRRYHLPVSPATIRNEMARLEEDGYISHPHTSAGRVPSDKGYRYYVERLMREEEIDGVWQETIRHQFHQVGLVQDEWPRLAAAVLARAVRNLAVVTAPSAPRLSLRHLELVAVQGAVALLIVVMDGGRIRQQLITFDEAVSQDDLQVLAAQLNQRFSGRTAAELSQEAATLAGREQQVLDATAGLVAAAERSAIDEAHLEGLPEVLSQPEFSQTDKMMAMLDLLDRHAVTRLLPLDIASDGITILIGEENPDAPIRECSVVMARYGAGPLWGVVAVIGPTRMRYARAVPTVRYLSGLMSDLVAAYYS